MNPKLINIQTLKEKTYDELDLGDYYNNLLGNIESKTSIFIYGTSGSGKSVFTMQLADHFSGKTRKSLYCSYEEALKKTMRERAKNFNISSTKLYVCEYANFEWLVDKITRNHYRMVIIDSVQFAEFTPAQQKQLSQTFRKRKIVWVFVSFGTGYKKPKCSVDIMHACDIKIFFDAGVATIDSRYKGETVNVRLFNPQRKTLQTNLFA